LCKAKAKKLFLWIEKISIGWIGIRKDGKYLSRIVSFVGLGFGWFILEDS